MMTTIPFLADIAPRSQVDGDSGTVIEVVLVVVVLAAIALLIWWLRRRRNRP